MLEYVKPIFGVGHSYESNNNTVAFLSIDEVLIIKEIIRNREILKLDGNFSSLGIYSPSDFFANQGFLSKVINSKTLKVITLPYKIESVDENRIICSEKEDKNRNLLSHLKNGNVEWKKSLKRGKYLFLGNSILIISKYLEDETVIGYNVENGEEQWSFNVSELGKWKDYNKVERKTMVSRILGIYKNRLYLYLNNGKVLILDSQSGEKIQVLVNNGSSNENSFGENFDYSLEIDCDRGKLIQLFRQGYMEIDLDTGLVTQTNIEGMNSLDLENTSPFVFDNNYIYFTDKYHYKLGALNRATLTIDWTYDFIQPDEDPQVRLRYGKELKLSGKNLLVLDNQNTLHIFKNRI